jgi:hypothetical protein
MSWLKPVTYVLALCLSRAVFGVPPNTFSD